jgi:hypothetical protein
MLNNNEHLSCILDPDFIFKALEPINYYSIKNYLH